MSDRDFWRAACLAALLAAGSPAALGQQPDLGRPARLELPDVALIDHDGVSRHLDSDLINGRITVISFVFTGCTTICSPVGANMGALDQLLGDEVGEQVSLLSVTLDPFNDTPARLAAWRSQFDERPGWRLLTGKPEIVDTLLHAMREDAPDISAHDAFLWLGDPRSGSWTRVSSLASPASLAALIHGLEDR